MYLDVFKESLADPCRATEVMESFMTLHSKARRFEETQHEMMKALMGVFKISEENRVVEDANADEVRDMLFKAEEELKECKGDPGMHNVMTTAEAQLSTTAIFARVEMWSKHVCWDGTTPIPAWVLDPEVPMNFDCL